MDFSTNILVMKAITGVTNLLRGERRQEMDALGKRVGFIESNLAQHVLFLVNTFEDTILKLYDLPASPNTRRVRIFIAEKNIEIEMVPIDMMSGENKPEEYLAKNPLGRMPLLKLDDGTCIAESIAICRYLENEFQIPHFLELPV
ncbi:MAG: hypothetical protein Ct9H90mP25_1940 [Gammaproteobacteria bacterium]|nr:MAG: hypothetical protein Ct9H90mP25_1940 [Gammaproteobacteria bacterium]